MTVAYLHPNLPTALIDALSELLCAHKIAEAPCWPRSEEQQPDFGAGRLFAGAPAAGGSKALVQRPVDFMLEYLCHWCATQLASLIWLAHCIDIVLREAFRLRRGCALRHVNKASHGT